MREARIRLPTPHKMQLLAWKAPANEILFGGATEGGKSLFNRLFLIYWCSRIPELMCDLFRLVEADVIKNHMSGEYSFPYLLRDWEIDGLVKITQTRIDFVKTGSAIYLEHCGSEKVLEKHQGVSRQIRIFEEGTQIREKYYRWLRSWCRISTAQLSLIPEDQRDYFPKIITTTNPIGISQGYYRRGFVDPAPPCTPFRAAESDGGYTRIYIPCKPEDNPHINSEATRRRVSGIGDAATTDALLNANWNAPVGDFLRNFRADRHIVEDILSPPPHWPTWRAFDWGSAEPFCCLWLTISDGEEFTDRQGRTRWFRRGCIVVYREWYGCDPEDPAKGIELSNKEIAAGILRESGESKGSITITDSLPFQARGGILMATEFANAGVPLVRGNTARIPGWKEIKNRFDGIDGFPMLAICRSCQRLIEYLPMLQRHPDKAEDAVEHGEATHACDTLRYGVMVFPTVRDAETQENYIEELVKSASRTKTPEQIVKNLNAPERKYYGRR